MMYSSPMRMKSVLKRLEIANLPTQETEAYRLQKITAKLPVTGPLLPVDDLGRPYLVSFERRLYGTLWDDTIYQAEKMLSYYHRISGQYPKEILLPAQRYFVRRCDRFYPFEDKAARIPFKYEDPGAVYQLLVRGGI